MRYDVGERSNFALAPMMRAALELVGTWTVEGIQEYCSTIATPVVDAAREFGFGVEDDEWRGNHLFGIRVPDPIRTEDARSELARRNVSVSVRGDAIRVAPHVYNTPDDGAALIAGLAALVGASA
jgi:selenocysteine lyase/cysteine desulfurase